MCHRMFINKFKSVKFAVNEDLLLFCLVISFVAIFNGVKYMILVQINLFHKIHKENMSRVDALIGFRESKS